VGLQMGLESAAFQLFVLVLVLELLDFAALLILEVNDSLSEILLVQLFL